MHPCIAKGDGAYVIPCIWGHWNNKGISSLLGPPCKERIMFQLKIVVLCAFILLPEVLYWWEVFHVLWWDASSYITMSLCPGRWTGFDGPSILVILPGVLLLSHKESMLCRLFKHSNFIGLGEPALKSHLSNGVDDTRYGYIARTIYKFWILSIGVG